MGYIHSNGNSNKYMTLENIFNTSSTDASCLSLEKYCMFIKKKQLYVGQFSHKVYDIHFSGSCMGWDII